MNASPCAMGARSGDTGKPRRLPPFGKAVSAILADPARLPWFVGCTADRASVFIATGPDAWDWREAHPRHLTVILPDRANPDQFCWDFLRGHHPVLILPPLASQAEQRTALAAAILRDGVESVLALGADAWPRFTRAVAA